MLDSLLESLASRPGFEDGRGISLGLVRLDNENSGATHTPSTRFSFDFWFMSEPRLDEQNWSRVACQRLTSPNNDHGMVAFRQPSF